MVTFSIENGTLIGEVEGLDKVWACKSRLEIPLSHIVRVVPSPPDAHNWWHGWKVLGTDMPGMFAAGLFRTGGRWVFWDVRHPDKTIEIDLNDDHYDRILVEVSDPDETAKMIEGAIVG